MGKRETGTRSGERVGIKELSRRLGLNVKTISEAEAAGKYVRGDDRKFDYDEVLAARAAVDPNRRRAGMLGAAVSSGKTLDEAKLDIDGEAPIETTPGGAGDRSLAESKRIEAAWKAERAELIYKKDMGSLIDREVTEASTEAMATTVQMKLKNLAPKLRPHMSDAGREILDREIDACLNEMAAEIRRMIGGGDA